MTSGSRPASNCMDLGSLCGEDDEEFGDLDSGASNFSSIFSTTFLATNWWIYSNSKYFEMAYNQETSTQSWTMKHMLFLLRILPERHCPRHWYLRCYPDRVSADRPGLLMGIFGVHHEYKQLIKSMLSLKSLLSVYIRSASLVAWT